MTSKRPRAVIQILAGFILFVLAVSIIHQFIIYPDFQRIEREEARKNLERCRQAIQSVIIRLTGLAKDWGIWDDTCRFVAGEFPDYIKVNLLPETFTNTQLQLITITGPDGRVIYHQAYDSIHQRLYRIAEFSGPRIGTRLLEAISKAEQTGSIQGLLRLDQGPLLVAVSPIFTSRGEGPCRGFCIMGQFLDEALLKDLHNQVGFPFQLIKPVRTSVPPGGFPLQLDSPVIRSWGIEKSHQFLEADAILMDVHQQPALQIRLEMERTITMGGFRSTGIATSGILLAGLLFLAGFLWWAQRSETGAKNHVHPGIKPWQYAGVVLAGLLGMLASFGFYKLADLHATGEAERTFQTWSRWIQKDIHHLVDLRLAELNTLASLFEGSERVEMSEFDVVCRRMAAIPGNTGDFAWIPLPPDPAFPAVHPPVHEGIEIPEIKPEFLFPATGGEWAGKISWRQQAPFLQSLARIRQTGQPAVTLLNPVPPGPAVLVFMAPVRQYRKMDYETGSLDTPLRGVAVKIQNRDSFITPLLAELEKGGIGVRIQDLTGAQDFITPAGALPPGGGAGPAPAGMPVETVQIDVGCSRWEVMIFAKPAGPGWNRHYWPWLVFGLGAGLTLLLTMYLYALQTARVRAEGLVAQRTGELQQSEIRHRHLVENIPGAVYRCEISYPWRACYISEEIENISGYPAASFLSHAVTFGELIHPADRAEAETKIRDSLIAGKPYDLTYRLKSADGAGKWLHERGQGVDGEEPGAKMREGVILDVTARVEQERELRRSLIKTRAMFETAGDGITFLSLDGRIVDTNAAACRIHGFGHPSEMIGLSGLDFVSAKDRRRAGHEMEELLTRGWKGVNEYEMLRRDGSHFTGELNGMMLYDEAGRPMELVITVRDITGRKQAEAAIRESEERFRIVTEKTGHLIYDYNVKTGQIHWSGAIREISGADPDTFQQVDIKAWEEMIHPGDRVRAVTLLEEAMTKRESYRVTYRFRHASGRYLFLEDDGRILEDDEGKPCRMLGIMRDVTGQHLQEEAQQRMEEQIRHTQKLESLGVLAGGIAHDFNNLLVAILGNAELAKQELPGDSLPFMYVRDIEAASHRAADLCRQMLAYSGRGRFVVDLLDLNRLVTEMAQMIEVSISKRAVLNYELAEPPPRVKGDATQIRQIILNLITNAAEAMGGRMGEIRLTTGVMECNRAYLQTTFLDEDLPDGKYAFLEVADNGCGMDDQTRSRMFDPFFTTKFTGRGLGMAAVLGIVRGHRGALVVDSAPGRGTAIRIFFPAVENQPLPGREPPAVEIPEWKGLGTILIVDDEEIVRQVGERMVSLLGFEVITARDGVEAVELYQRSRDRVVCVLVDLTMPGIDGEETLRRLRMISPGLPVIMCSGYHQQELSERFLHHNINGFIQKPFRVASLREVLRKATGKSAEPAPG